eukprot:m.87933 g.87933  ORF g.87933 m.87933 type:complete len:63 (+) comp14519_c0_seq8:1053-1241(+)
MFFSGNDDVIFSSFDGDETDGCPVEVARPEVHLPPDAELYHHIEEIHAPSSIDAHSCDTYDI